MHEEKINPRPEFITQMRTRGTPFWKLAYLLDIHPGRILRLYPYPHVFGKRVCNVLKTNDRARKKCGRVHKMMKRSYLGVELRKNAEVRHT
jgi:hypothetical protein